MIPGCRIQKNLLKVTLAFVAVSGLAQAPPKYDLATEMKIKGVVEELKFVPPTGGKPVAYLVLKSGRTLLRSFFVPRNF